MRLLEMVKISGLAEKAPFYLINCDSAYQSACCAFAEKPGIYLPDVYASEFYWQEQQHNYISTLAYMRMINDLVEMDITNYELLFAAFVILHEYGHWLHFRRYHKGAPAYISWLNRQLAPVERQAALLAKIPAAEPLKEELTLQHIDAYNSMPQELSANKYALKHLPGFYAKVLKQQNK